LGKTARYINCGEDFKWLVCLDPTIGAAMVSLDYRFLAVNKELCWITGYLEKELTSWNFYDITYPDDFDNYVVHALQLKADEIDHTFRFNQGLGLFLQN